MAKEQLLSEIILFFRLALYFHNKFFISANLTLNCVVAVGRIQLLTLLILQCPCHQLH